MSKREKTVRVLHVLKSNIYSGAEHVVCAIIKNMPENYECLYLSPNGPIMERLKQEDIMYRGVEKLTVNEIRKVVKEYEPDVVHAHDFTASVLSALACDNKQTIISHIHCNPEWLQKRNAKTLLYWLLKRRFKKIMLVSDAVKQEFVFADKMKEKFVTVGNPFSVQEVIEKSRYVNGVQNCDVIYVGRLSDEKNPLMFIDIIAELKKIKADVLAIIVGEGNLRQTCQDKIQEMRLQDNITMVGFQENPYAFILNAKVICIPSKWEGFGLVALEAMALGVPVVCSGAGGLKEIVNDSCGKIVDRVIYNSQEEEITQYVDEIKQLLSDESYCLKKSDNARRQACAFDNVDVYMKSVLMIYQQS